VTTGHRGRLLQPVPVWHWPDLRRCHCGSPPPALVLTFPGAGGAAQRQCWPLSEIAVAAVATARSAACGWRSDSHCRRDMSSALAGNLRDQHESVRLHAVRRGLRLWAAPVDQPPGNHRPLLPVPHRPALCADQSAQCQRRQSLIHSKRRPASPGTRADRGLPLPQSAEPAQRAVLRTGRKHGPRTHLRS
jgi:hypothetical protein